MKSDNLFIENKAYELRRLSLIATSQAGSGHLTSCLSAADIVAVLFFYSMRFSVHDPRNSDNDRFILSKGHASALLYAVWQQLGLITEHELLSYRTKNSVLEGHPTPRFSPVLVATGSLGMGLANGVGMSWLARVENHSYCTYVLLGDSELAEGSVWEAVQLAAFYSLSNLVAIVDCNGLGQSGEPMYDHHADAYARMFEAFGWQTYVVDGHDVAALMKVFDEVGANQNGKKPIAIIAKTIKGYGIKQVEEKQGYHGKTFAKKELDGLLDELKKRFPVAAAYQAPNNWQPKPVTTAHHSNNAHHKSIVATTRFKSGEKIAPRKAFGITLAESENENLIVLDAEVKNSTYTELFEKRYSHRFFQAFIAEQALVSVATGIAACGKIPFLATFGAFLTRAHDQIRMAAIGKNALRIAGTHAGVSIGQDGPSQMALEDIAMMRALVDSIVLYPADAVSTQALVNQMIGYNQGISYVRLTREETSVLYDEGEQFYIGGCKVLRKSDADSACIIGAGVTLFEALKAYDMMAAQGKSISVIDLYSVKPFDVQTVFATVVASNNTVLVVEDHYRQGGIGEAIAAALISQMPSLQFMHLAVDTVPHSATAQEQRALQGIDAQAIVHALSNQRS
jgi:transketolase